MAGRPSERLGNMESIFLRKRQPSRHRSGAPPFCSRIFELGHFFGQQKWS
jgi:hypothetical protein